MPKFRRKPVIIEAEQYRPGLEDGFAYRHPSGQLVFNDDGRGNLLPVPEGLDRVPVLGTKLRQGWVVLTPDHWIITEQGERRAVTSEAFAKLYEPAE